MKKAKVLSFIGFLFVFCMLSGITAAEEFDTDFILRGESSSPVSVSIIAPQYKHIAQYGQDRKESLNKLIRHFSLSVVTDGSISKTTFRIDQDPLWSSFESLTGAAGKTAYSFGNETVYVSDEQKDSLNNSVFAAFLNTQFFPVNRLLDDLYPVFEKAEDTFKEFVRSAKVALTFKGYGKGVKRLTIPIPDQYVRDHFPGIIADLAETEECRQFLSSLIFSGSQKIILLFDQDDRLLRVNYDGIAGFNENSLRKVSIVWRCYRENGVKKDNISVKTPSQKGNDRYNFTYEREIDLTDPSGKIIQSDLQIDLKNEQIRKKIGFIADLQITGQTVSGKAEYNEKLENGEKKITVVPSLKKENMSEYSGTIEIDHYSGKILISSVVTDINLSASSKPDLQDADAAEPRKETVDEEQIQELINRIILRKLFTLPKEDLVFFSMDIPDETWDMLVQSLI